MASITLNLDTRTVRNGECMIRARISHNGTNSYINTGVRVSPDQFDAASLYSPVSRKAYMHEMKNEQVSAIVRKYDEVIFDIKRSDELDLDTMTANDIRTYIVGERTCQRKRVARSTRKRGDRGDFSVWFDIYAGTKGERVQSDMMYVSRLIAEYCTSRGIDRIWFDELKYDMLVDMEHWLHATGRGDATRVKVFSYIRSAWNEAERREMVEYGKTPFRFYKIKPVPLKDDIEPISTDGLRKLIALELTEGTELCRARDMLVLSFYLCGPNFRDMFDMRLPADGYVVYYRHKNENRSQRSVHIYVEPEMQAIIDKYHGSELLLFFNERGSKYTTTQRNLNRECARLSELVGESVNMAAIRRTWSTIAGELEVPDRVNNKSTGHVDSSVKDKHYEQYDWERTRKYNRKVIDYVLYGMTE